MTADDGRAPLDATVLNDRVIGSCSLWRRIDVVTETGSTNADMLARAADGENIDGVVLIAEHQTAGRGRQGRIWADAPGAQITMSVGVDAASVPTTWWGWLPLATGVAIVDTVSALGVHAGLKWPNDVLAGGRKLAGILAEVAAAQHAVVIGIGLNVSLRGDEVGIAGVTSLVELGVTAPDRQRLVSDLLSELGNRIEAWRNASGTDAALMAAYRARSITVGMPVRAVLPGNREIVGVAHDVDEQGRLAINTEEGPKTVSAGDIVHLRPAGS